MSNRILEITCHKCGHTWYVDPDELDERDLDLYKGEEPETYRVRCPKCHTKNVFHTTDCQ